MRTLQQGSVVFGWIPHPNGTMPKTQHPAVVVSTDKEIAESSDIFVVAISRSILDPMPDGHFLIPWHRDSHPETGLNARCAVKCDWLVRIAKTAITRVVGRTPAALFQDIEIHLQKRLALRPKTDANQSKEEQSEG